MCMKHFREIMMTMFMVDDSNGTEDLMRLNFMDITIGDDWQAQHWDLRWLTSSALRWDEMTDKLSKISVWILSLARSLLSNIFIKVEEDNVKPLRMTVTGVITIIRSLKMLDVILSLCFGLPFQISIYSIDISTKIFKWNKFLVLGCLRNHKRKTTSIYFQIVQSVNVDVGEKEAPSIWVFVVETGSNQERFNNWTINCLVLFLQQFKPFNLVSVTFKWWEE